MPYAFQSIDELHSAISAQSVQDSIERFLSRHSRSIAEIVERSVAGNTFRAFQFKRHQVGFKPSQLYRDWTSERLQQDFQILVKLPSFETMINELILMATDLDNYWHNQTQGVDQVRIRFGRAAKLLGLSVKHLLWHDQLSEADRQRMISTLNVPLDSYTLQGICFVAPDLNIPRNATMKFVRDEEHYRMIQRRILQLMPEGRHPVHYEFAAWNIAHPGII